MRWNPEQAHKDPCPPASGKQNLKTITYSSGFQRLSGNNVTSMGSQEASLSVFKLTPGAAVAI